LRTVVIGSGSAGCNKRSSGCGLADDDIRTIVDRIVNDICERNVQHAGDISHTGPVVLKLRQINPAWRAWVVLRPHGIANRGLIDYVVNILR
jgi:hypothetical protein